MRAHAAGHARRAGAAARRRRSSRSTRPPWPTPRCSTACCVKPLDPQPVDRCRASGPAQRAPPPPAVAQPVSVTAGAVAVAEPEPAARGRDRRQPGRASGRRRRRVAAWPANRSLDGDIHGPDDALADDRSTRSSKSSRCDRPSGRAASRGTQPTPMSIGIALRVAGAWPRPMRRCRRRLRGVDCRSGRAGSRRQPAERRRVERLAPEVERGRRPSAWSAKWRRRIRRGGGDRAVVRDEIARMRAATRRRLATPRRSREPGRPGTIGGFSARLRRAVCSTAMSTTRYPSHDRSREAGPRRASKAKWHARWEARGHLRLRPHARPRRGVLHRHAAADGQRIAARRPRVFLHPHRHHRPLPADARQGGVLPDGMGRQRPADRAARAELLRRALRSVAAVRRRRSCRRRQPAKQPISVSRPNFIELCTRLTVEDEKVVRASVAASRPVGRLVDDLRHHRQAGAARVAADVPAPARSAARPTSSKRRRCGTSTSGPPSRRRSSRIASMPGAYHRMRVRASAADRRPGIVEIETTRPELIPACVALVAHPDDERYQAAVRHRGRDAAVRRARCRCRRTPLADPEKGSGIAMICTFGDTHRRDLVARAEAAGARDHSAERHARSGDVGRARLGIARTRPRRRRPTTSWPACRPTKAQRARSSSCCARAGDLLGDAAADHAQRQVLREGRSAARDHHQPPVVHQDACEFREALIARGREMQWHPEYMRHALRELGATA